MSVIGLLQSNLYCIHNDDNDVIYHGQNLILAWCDTFLYQE